MQQLIKFISIPFIPFTIYNLGYYSNTIVTEWRKLYN